MNNRLALGAASLIFVLTTPGRSQPRPPPVRTDAGSPDASFRPTSACVPIPNRNWRLRRNLVQSSPPDPSYPFEHSDAVSMGTSEPFDLDGDGHADTLVPEPEPGDCVQDFHFAIYVARGACGHRVGMVYGTIDVASIAVAPRNAGLPDLTSVTEHQQQPDPRVPAELRRETRTYRFDGTSYREVAHVVNVSVCHHCPRQHCEHSPMAP